MALRYDALGVSWGLCRFRPDTATDMSTLTLCGEMTEKCFAETIRPSLGKARRLIVNSMSGTLSFSPQGLVSELRGLLCGKTFEQGCLYELDNADHSSIKVMLAHALFFTDIVPRCQSMVAFVPSLVSAAFLESDADRAMVSLPHQVDLRFRDLLSVYTLGPLASLTTNPHLTRLTLYLGGQHSVFVAHLVASNRQWPALERLELGQLSISEEFLTCLEKGLAPLLSLRSLLFCESSVFETHQLVRLSEMVVRLAPKCVEIQMPSSSAYDHQDVTDAAWVIILLSMPDLRILRGETTLTAPFLELVRRSRLLGLYLELKEDHTDVYDQMCASFPASLRTFELTTAQDDQRSSESYLNGLLYENGALTELVVNDFNWRDISHRNIQNHARATLAIHTFSKVCEARLPPEIIYHISGFVAESKTDLKTWSRAAVTIHHDGGKRMKTM